MKYTDFDMKMMALGEIAAQLIALLVAVGSWFYLGDLSVFIKVPVALVVLLVVAELALKFVHVGYNPEQEEA